MGELLSLLEKHNAPGQQDLLAMLGQIAGMEKQLAAAVEELAAMRGALAEAQKQNHPVKTAMQKAVIVMQGQVLELRDKLTELKQTVIDGCKSAVAAFKEHGVAALDNVARFFKVKPVLETVRDNLHEYIRQDEKAIAKITVVSSEYHEAGLHLKNMFRTMTGREPMAEPKGPGALARTLAAPFRHEKALFTSIKGHAEGALKRLEHLEQAAERPSIRKTMEEMSEKAAKAQQGREKSAPAVKRDER